MASELRQIHDELRFWGVLMANSSADIRVDTSLYRNRPLTTAELEMLTKAAFSHMSEAKEALTEDNTMCLFRPTNSDKLLLRFIKGGYTEMLDMQHLLPH